MAAFAASFAACPPHQAPCVDEAPVLTESQLILKKQKAVELLSREEIRYEGRHSRSVLRLRPKTYYAYGAWDPCYKSDLKFDSQVNQYGNIEVMIHRRTDMVGCRGMKLVIDPSLLTMSYYDYDHVFNTLDGLYSRLVTFVK